MRKLIIMSLVLLSVSLQGNLHDNDAQETGNTSQKKNRQLLGGQNLIINPVIQAKRIKLNDNYSQKPTSPKLIGFHITFDSGLFYTKGIDDLVNIFDSWGFGDDISAPPGPWGGQPSYEHFPRGNTDAFYRLKDLKIELSLSKRLTLGYMYSPLRDFKVQGFKYTKRPTYIGTFSRTWKAGQGVALTGEFSGGTNYLFASYMPVLPLVSGRKLPKNLYVKVAAGIGLCKIQFDLHFGEIKNHLKTNPCFYGLFEFGHYFSRNLSIGFNVDYKDIPFRTDTSSLLGFNFPEERIYFGGYGVGLNIGIHL